MNTETILVRPSELPKTFELESTSVINYLVMGLGIIIIAVSVFSLIFAPSTLYYHGSLTFFQVIYMSPGPVASVGILLVGMAIQIPAARINNKAKEILESHQLDPNANAPQGAQLGIEQGDNELLLVMVVEVDEEVEKAEPA